MKLFFLLIAMCTLLLSATDCGKKTSHATKYRARLETKGICLNYTIRLLDDADSLDINKNWTDEVTHKSYTNVFALGNPCSFPAAIKEGEEFYFTVDTTVDRDCAICMAYYPKPSKSLIIKVVDK